jgi:hypothetical protein
MDDFAVDAEQPSRGCRNSREAMRCKAAGARRRCRLRSRSSSSSDGARRWSDLSSNPWRWPRRTFIRVPRPACAARHPRNRAARAPAKHKSRSCGASSRPPLREREGPGRGRNWRGSAVRCAAASGVEHLRRNLHWRPSDLGVTGRS